MRYKTSTNIKQGIIMRNSINPPLFRIYAPEKRPANPKGNKSGIPACHHDCPDKAFTGFVKGDFNIL